MYLVDWVIPLESFRHAKALVRAGLATGSVVSDQIILRSSSFR